MCLLVWNYHPILAAEREWLQRVFFRWKTSERFHFRVLDAAVAGGSHHQKFAVIDGRLAFLGGMDVCEGRWDDRRHLAENPVRLSRGWAQKPYHDVQAYLDGGEAPTALEAYFFEPDAGEATIREVERLFVDAIAAAERLVYIAAARCAARSCGACAIGLGHRSRS